MATQTPNFDFDLPDIGADSDAWGDFLNGNWTDLDVLLLTFLQLSGGTMTGQITLPGGGTGLEAATVDSVVTVAGDLATHEADVANPHVVTALQSGAIDKTGDAMTGPLTTVDLFLGAVVQMKVAILASAAAIPLSMDDASKKTIALATNTTITVSGEVADQTVEVWITQTSGGGTAAWVGVDKWIGGVPPILSANIGDIDIIVLVSESDGTTIIGQHIGVAS